MTAVRCPYPDCTYSTSADLDPAVTAVVLSTHAMSHSRASKAKPAPVKRPEISSGGTTENWSYFTTRWKAYSGAVQLSAQDTTIQLLECCDAKLRRDITRNAVGPVRLEDMTEENLLKAIRALAVREENPKVARVALSRMTQDRGEPVRAFAARLRGQAEVCRFLKKCAGCDLISNQGEERVADQLCVGLADAEIQEDLLKHQDQDMGVEDTIRFVEVRAAGKRSAVSMTTPTSTNAIDDDEGSEAVSSAYRRQQRRPIPRPGQGPGKATPTRPQATPHPNPRNTSSRGQSQPLERITRATPTKRGVCTFCGLLGHGEQERTAPPSVPPAPPADAKTTQPRCAGSQTWSTRVPYPSRSTQWSKGPSTTRHGTQPPNSGPRGSLHPNPTSTSPYRHALRTSGITGTHCDWRHTHSLYRCNGGHRLPKLPGWSQTPIRASAYHLGPHPGQLGDALSQRKQPADPGSRNPEDQGTPHRP